MALKDDIRFANDTADAAEALRQDLRWNVKPGEPDREDSIKRTLELIRQAMIPIRSAMGHAVHGQIPAAVEEKVRDASKRLQYERKQLKKMRR